MFFSAIYKDYNSIYNDRLTRPTGCTYMLNHGPGPVVVKQRFPKSRQVPSGRRGPTCFIQGKGDLQGSFRQGSTSRSPIFSGPRVWENCLPKCTPKKKTNMDTPNDAMFERRYVLQTIIFDHFWYLC